jgi:putative hydrolase of the HAD superfamily
VLALGANAVYVPHHLTWVHEVAEPPPVGHPGYYELEHLGGLPALINQLEHTFI